MNLPAYLAHQERRLACQVKILGEIKVTRFNGYFGNGAYSIWTPE